MKKTTVIAIVVVVAAISFWIGTYYQSQRFMANRPFGMFRQMQRQGGSRPPDFGDRGPGSQMRERVLSGRLDRVDEGELTITTNFGSLKVLIEDRTQINRTQKAALDDLMVGKQVIIQGTVDEEGRIKAKSVIGKE